LKLKFNFTIIFAMACLAHSAPEPGGERTTPPSMTRCECADVAFAEIARELAAGDRSLDEARRRTGCGLTCTACLPDLRRYLSSL
jgi:NAD(P)H-nitrite reductase large subunit